jgi:hypothetical protein
MTIFKADPISSAAKDVLGQLFMKGPTWDGNITSKSGRGELVSRGLAFHAHGFASLTEEGVRVAIEWKDFHRPLTAWSQQWLRKAGGA